MQDVRLSSGEVCQIAGVSPAMLARWASAWLTGEAKGGRGQGHYRIYSSVEALAIAIGNRWRQEGESPERVAELVYHVARLDAGEMEQSFRDGLTFPDPPRRVGEVVLPGTGSGLIERPVDIPEGIRALMRKLDLQVCWCHVKREIAKLARHPNRRKRGRQPKSKLRSSV
jgi:DNA-binding transcriptional MerR regulator